MLRDCSGIAPGLLRDCSGIAPGLLRCCTGRYPMGIRWVSDGYPMGIRWVSDGYPMGISGDFGSPTGSAPSRSLGLTALVWSLVKHRNTDARGVALVTVVGRLEVEADSP